VTEPSLEWILKNAVAIAPLRMDSFDARLYHNLWFAFDEEHPLAHYIKLEHFENLLRASALRFKRLDLYKDSYEGRYPAANRTKEATVSANLTHDLKIKNDLDAMITSQNIARKYSYIHCWFGQEAENLPMWERYADQGRGICVKSSTSSIRSSLQPPPDLHLHLGKVTYSDEATPIGSFFSEAPAFRKHPDYQQESEYRLLAQIKLENLPTGKDGYLEVAPDFRLVDISLPKFAHEVLIGPRCSIDQTKHVFEIANRYLPGIPIRSSDFW